MTSSAMILECPSCQARFEIGAGVEVVGRKVRCSRCAHVWQVQKAEAEQRGAPVETLGGAATNAGNQTSRQTSPVAVPPATPGADMPTQAPVQQQPSRATHPQHPSPPTGYPATGPGPTARPVTRPPTALPQPRVTQPGPAPTADTPATQATQLDRAGPADAPTSPDPLGSAVPSQPSEQDAPSDAQNSQARSEDSPAAPAAKGADVTAGPEPSDSDISAAPSQQDTTAPNPIKSATPPTQPDPVPSRPHAPKAADASTSEQNAPKHDSAPSETDERDESRPEIDDSERVSDDDTIERLSEAAQEDTAPEETEADSTSDEVSIPPTSPPGATVASDTKIKPVPQDAGETHDAEQKSATPSKASEIVQTPDGSANIARDAAPIVASAGRIEPTFGGPAVMLPGQAASDRSNSSLEAALGDVFATPLDHVEQRIPLGAPVEHANNQHDAGPIGDLSTAARERTQSVNPGMPDAHDQTNYSSYGRERSAYPTTVDPTFSSPDEIAPDPSLERSHIDLRTDAPFATDFTQDASQPVPGERRGQHVHADLHRRRAAINLGWFCLAAVVGSLIGIVTLGRDSVVRALPGAANFYSAVGAPVNTRGLDFADVSYDWVTDRGRPAIAVKGKIRNVSDVPLDVPTVVFVLLDDRGDELYNWASRVRDDPIEAGGEAAFKAQVPAPPGAARRLRVRFARKSR